MTTYSFWMPYGISATRRKGTPKPEGAPHMVVRCEPMPNKTGTWYSAADWLRFKDESEDDYGCHTLIDQWGEEEDVCPIVRPTPSKVQHDNRQYSGSGSDNSNQWNFDALDEGPPWSSFVDPDGEWVWFDEVRFGSLETLNGWGVGAHCQSEADHFRAKAYRSRRGRAKAQTTRASIVAVS